MESVANLDPSSGGRLELKVETPHVRPSATTTSAVSEVLALLLDYLTTPPPLPESESAQTDGHSSKDASPVKPLLQKSVLKLITELRIYVAIASFVLSYRYRSVQKSAVHEVSFHILCPKIFDTELYFRSGVQRDGLSL